jgi:hypothetical protein
MIIDELFEGPQMCPECGGISFSDLILAEKKDACYYKVKASAKVWPSAYASGRLVQCRKKGAANYGNKSEGVMENNDPYEPEAYDEFVSDTYSDDNPEDEQGVAEGSLEEAHHGSLLDHNKGQFASVIFQSQWDTDPQIDYYNNLDDAKFDTENASAHHGSVYAWNGARWVRKMSATERNGSGGGYGSWAENKQGVAEEYELAGVGVAYELGRRAYQERKTIRDNPYSATREARKHDEWEKGLERGKHDANDAKLFRRSVGEQGVAEGQLEMNTPDPVVVVQDLKGKILDKINLSVAAQKYKLGPPQNIKTQLAHQNYTKVGNYMIVSPMSGQPQDATTQGVAETELDEKSVSQAQFRTMAGAAHNPAFARKVGISQDVAQEFNQADKNSNYKKLPARATEGEQQKGADYRDPKEVDYDDEYNAMVARVKKLAGLGPMKTVYDPAKRQYRNMPTAQQPKK